MFSLLDRIQNDKAIRTLWSQNPAERAVAATFLRLGDQLEAQWESNDIQRRLCGIALQTNDMLSDMRSSLSDLTAAQERTNELLAQSLAVQTDHYMLEKRQRVLKDALFRWNDILTTGEGLTDPHWVLIASRTFLEFLKAWDFTTEDLEDADEKRSLLNQVKRASTNIGSTPEDVSCEVNVFQTLYAECEDLLANPVCHAEEDKDALPCVKSMLVDLLRRHFPGKQFQSTGRLPWILALSSALFKGNEAASVRTTIVSSRVPTNERLILGIYGKAEFAGNCRLLFFTDNAWYEMSLKGATWSDPTRHDYATGDACGVFDGYKLYSPRSDAQQLIATAKELPHLISSTTTQHEDEKRRLRDSREAQVAKERQDYENKKASALTHIKAYLDTHPLVAEFYPRIKV
jgi:hypothetical protein